MSALSHIRNIQWSHELIYENSILENNPIPRRPRLTKWSFYHAFIACTELSLFLFPWPISLANLVRDAFACSELYCWLRFGSQHSLCLWLLFVAYSSGLNGSTTLDQNECDLQEIIASFHYALWGSTQVRKSFTKASLNISCFVQEPDSCGASFICGYIFE
jgi:hypothetical protein